MAIEYDVVHNTEKTVFCKKCNETCRSCVEEGSTECQTCNEYKFLNTTSLTERKGECANKTFINETILTNETDINRNDSRILVVTNRNRQRAIDDTTGHIQTDLMQAIF